MNAERTTRNESSRKRASKETDLQTKVTNVKIVKDSWERAGNIAAKQLLFILTELGFLS